MQMKLCSWAGCDRLCAKGSYYCEQHDKIAKARREKHNAERFSRFSNSGKRTKSGEYHSLYDTSEWRIGRKEYLQGHPYCFICGAKATVVDHIRPHRGDRTIFFDRNNWQPLCWQCHSRKTRQEQRDLPNR